MKRKLKRKNKYRLSKNPWSMSGIMRWMMENLVNQKKSLKNEEEYFKIKTKHKHSACEVLGCSHKVLSALIKECFMSPSVIVLHNNRIYAYWSDFTDYGVGVLSMKKFRYYKKYYDFNIIEKEL